MRSSKNLNLLLLVVDSLRYDHVGQRAHTPFLSSLGERGFFRFERAYSTECWTLPSHVSMFTGLMPSQHGAHFQHMGYVGEQPTLAEVLSQRGYSTHLITRNTIFDGGIPGVNRGFQHIHTPMAKMGWTAPIELLWMLSKPRIRRAVRETGYFSLLQKESGRFLRDMVRRVHPADEMALRLTQEKLKEPGNFVFVNLYDVHSPYSPVPNASHPLPTSKENLEEVLAISKLMPRIVAHDHLRDGFQVSSRDARALRRRYRKAVELMDGKLEAFFRGVDLENTVVVLTSDHGEAFGEEGLWGHDSSVLEVHNHVPLFVWHPHLQGEPITDCVSLKEVYDFLSWAGEGHPGFLSSKYRRNYAQCEHIPYRTDDSVKEKFRTPKRTIHMNEDWA